MSYSNLPVHLQVEPSQLCNLNCMGCSIVDVHKGRKRSVISIEDFKTLVFHAPSIKDITLHGLGEPFLNDDFGKIVTFLKDEGIVARTLTNGNIINPNIDTVALLESLVEIGFSIDGGNKKTYETVRRGGNFEKFKRIVSDLSELRQKRGCSSCVLSLHCTISIYNLDGILDIPELARELGIDKVSFNFMGQFYYSREDGDYNRVEKIKNLSKTVLRSLMERMEEKCKRMEIDISYPPIGRKRHLDCFWPIRAAFLTAEGFVTSCNYRMNPKILCFGNLLTQTMDEIWYSEEYLKFREDFHNKEVPILLLDLFLKGGEHES